LKKTVILISKDKLFVRVFGAWGSSTEFGVTTSWLSAEVISMGLDSKKDL